MDAYLSQPIEQLIRERKLRSRVVQQLPPAEQTAGWRLPTDDEPAVTKADCDVLIVGSGYGGAVAAARLAESGVGTVWLFERGKEYRPGDFPESWSELAGHVRAQRPDRNDYIGDPQALFDIRTFGAVNVLVGSGLGGTSLINANVVLRPAAEVFSRLPWPRAFRDAPEILTKHFEKAESMLGVDVESPRKCYAKYEALERTAEKIRESFTKQWHEERGCDLGPPDIRCRPAPIAVNFVEGKENPVGVAQRACTGCGNCVTGCNVGAKNTVAMNYLPYAWRRRVAMYTGAGVLRVQRHGDLWRVYFRRTLTEKHPILGREAYSVYAKTVILAAGALGSTEILLRSRAAKHVALSPMLGRYFSANGDNIGAGYSERKEVSAARDLSVFSNRIEDIRQPGPTITGYIDMRDAMRSDRAPLIEDAAIPSSLGHAYGESLATCLMPVQMQRPRFLDDHGVGLTEPLGVDVGALHRTQVYLMMGDDGAGGNLLLTWPESVDPVQGRESKRFSEYDRARVAAYWPDAGRAPIFEKQFRVLDDAYKSRLDDGVFVPSMLWRPLPKEMSDALAGSPASAVLTVHPLGGCPMGDDFLTGVVDKHGQVYFPPQIAHGVKAAKQYKVPFEVDDPDDRDAFELNKEGIPVYKGLYVWDGSIVPTALGVNPLLTIAALAEYAAEYLGHKLTAETHGLKVEDEPRPAPQVAGMVSPASSASAPKALPMEPCSEVRLRFCERLSAKPGELDDLANGALRRLESSVRGAGRNRVRVWAAGKLQSWQDARRPRLAYETLRILAPGAPPSRLKDPNLRLELQLELLVPDFYAMLRDPGHVTKVDWTDEEASHAKRASKGSAKLAVVSDDPVPLPLQEWNGHGTMWWPRRQRGSTLLAAVRALWKWFWARGLREFRWERIKARDTPVQFIGNAVQRVLGGGAFTRLARHIGERRTMGYRFEFLRPGDHLDCIELSGIKRLDYTHRRNVWLQFTELETTLTIHRNGHPVKRRTGTLSVQVADLVRLPGLPTLRPENDPKTPRSALSPDGQSWWIGKDERSRVARIDAADTPSAIGAATSFGLFAARLLFKTHFWTFWPPEYRSAYARRDRLPNKLRDAPVSTAYLIDVPKEWHHGYGPFAPGYRAAAAAYRGPDGTWRPRTPLHVRKGGREHTRIMLTRYCDPATATQGPVLLIHGLFASSQLFATDSIDTNMAQYLCAKGFDVWLLDLRVSPAMEAVWDQTSFDVVAHVDIPAAVAFVLAMTRREKLRVVAHCMGSAAFWMSVLDGCLEYVVVDEQGRGTLESRIESAVCTQVGPYMIVTEKNRTEGNLAALLRDLIIVKHVDVSVNDEASMLDVLADRVAGSLPYTNEDHAHRPRCCEIDRTFANCNRAIAVDGPMWLHRNLDPRTHARLDELLSVANIRYFFHVMHFGLRSRVTDEQGRNVYVRKVKRQVRLDAKPDPLYFAVDRPGFPVRFIHGKENGVFAVEGAKKNVRKWHTLFPGRPNQRNRADLIIVPGYSHLDAIFGRNACNDVFPYISDHFLGEQNGTIEPFKETFHPPRPSVLPRTGPVIGWARPAHAGADAPIIVRMMVEGRSDITPWPRTVHVKAQVGDDEKWRPLRFFGANAARQAQRRGVDGRFVFDVEVPRDARTLLVGIEYEPLAELMRPCNENVHAAVDLHLLPWWRRLARRAERGGRTVSFLCGSCRYPGSPFERHVADRIFEQVYLQAIDPEAGTDYWLLLGDQIYADATSDIFDTASERERFIEQHRDAYTAEHMRCTLASLPAYFATDDHEIENDYQGNPTQDQLDKLIVDSHVRDDIARKRLYALGAVVGYQWGISPRTASSGKLHRGRFWYDFEVGGVPTFVMDTRTERELRSTISDHEPKIVSDAQFAALGDWLARTTANGRRREPRFIVSGSVLAPLLRAQCNGQMDRRNSDNWFGYPASIGKLVDLLFEHDAQNTIFIAGDYHLSCVADLTFERADKELRALSVVASGFYTPMPFANTRWDEIQDEFDGPFPCGSGMRLLYGASLLSVRDNFVRVTLEHAEETGRTLVVEVTEVARHGHLPDDVVRGAIDVVEVARNDRSCKRRAAIPLGTGGSLRFRQPDAIAFK